MSDGTVLSVKNVRSESDENTEGDDTEQVGLSDPIRVFETVESSVVTPGDVASATMCSRDTARRKLDRGRVGRCKNAGRIVYWRPAGADPRLVDPDDPIFDRTAEQIAASDDQQISVGDHLDSVLRDEVDIEHIFAFEPDFRILGLTRVPVDTGDVT